MNKFAYTIGYGLGKSAFWPFSSGEKATPEPKPEPKPQPKPQPKATPLSAARRAQPSKPKAKAAPNKSTNQKTPSRAGGWRDMKMFGE